MCLPCVPVSSILGRQAAERAAKAEMESQAATERTLEANVSLRNARRKSVGAAKLHGSFRGWTLMQFSIGTWQNWLNPMQFSQSILFCFFWDVLRALLCWVDNVNKHEHANCLRFFWFFHWPHLPLLYEYEQNWEQYDKSYFFMVLCLSRSAADAFS